MNKFLAILCILAVFTLVGAGCFEIITPEDQPVAVPSGDVKAPTPDEIGTEDIFDEEEGGEEAEPGDELNALIEEIESIEAEADRMFKDLENIDAAQDKNLDI